MKNEQPIHSSHLQYTVLQLYFQQFFQFFCKNKWTTEAVQKCCLNDPKGLGGKCAYLFV